MLILVLPVSTLLVYMQKYIRTCIYKTPRFSTESQGLREETKIPRVANEGSVPIEKKRGRRELLYPHPKLSLGLDPYIGPLLYSRCSMLKNGQFCYLYVLTYLQSLYM